MYINAWGWCTGTTQRDGTGRKEGSGWGTRVYLWQIHVDIWQNQYNIVKLKKKKRIGALKKKPLSVQFEFTQRVSIGKVQLLWNDCIVLYFMYLRVIPKTSYKYHKYMVCKKSMSKI